MDRSSPEAVLATIRDAIALDVLDSLRALCDPFGMVDNPSNTLCHIATDDMRHIDRFKTWFSDAVATGPVTYAGDTAALPVMLAPHTQARAADLMMINRRDQWYLMRFNWK